MSTLENCVSYCVDWESLDELIDASESVGQSVREYCDTPIVESVLAKRSPAFRVKRGSVPEFQTGQILGESFTQ